MTTTTAGARPATAGARGGSAAPLLFLLAAALPAIGVHWLATGPLARSAATVGEAATAAAAFAASRVDGAAALWPDAPSVVQLAAVEVVAGPLGGGSVLDTARAAVLAVGLLTALLVWPVARRLGLRPAAAAAGVLAAGVPTAVVGLHSAVDAGVLAAAWLALAAAVPTRGRGLVALSGLAVVAAVLTAPLAAVPVLALGSHLVLARVVAFGLKLPARIAVAAAPALGAVVVAWLATGERPLAVTGDGAVDTPVIVGAAAVTAVVAALTVWRLRWARPLATAALAAAACALVPGPSQTTAAALLVPAAAVLFALLIDEVGGIGARPRAALGLAAAVAVAVTVVPTLPVVARAATTVATGGTSEPADGAATDATTDGDTDGAATAGTDGAATDGATADVGDDGALAAWVTAELEPDAVLVADALTWAQLLRDGVPAQRVLVAGTSPVPQAAFVVDTPRPGRRAAAPAVSAAVASVPVAVIADGPGGARAEIRRPVADAEAARTAAALDLEDRRRVGALLARNPSLVLPPDAAQRLAAGGVDARLITVLAGFAASHRIEVSAFAVSPAEPPDAPSRVVRISMVDGWPVSDQGAADLTQRWLAAQLPPYRPLSVLRADGELIIRYSAPSPLGLLGR